MCWLACPSCGTFAAPEQLLRPEIQENMGERAGDKEDVALEGRVPPLSIIAVHDVWHDERNKHNKRNAVGYATM